MDTPLDELQWKSPEWIQAFGLRTDNVLDYFAESPFFDKTSNNQVIKMQRQFQQEPSQEAGSDDFGHLDAKRREILIKYPVYAMLERELMKLKGIEYVLVQVREPDFWTIRKQNRHSINKTETLQDYYVIGANVYQSPTIFNIVMNRLMTTNYHFNETIKSLYDLTEFKPSQGIQFKKFEADKSSNGTTTESHTVSTSATATATTNATTAQLDNSKNDGSRQLITQEMLDKLMVTSIKSKPEYI
ncbi:hypothetical protein KAFR_0D04570 [Kazachstania africana CBS 2517]|uniref:Mediator of RNA polymerase II transcription subunit 6 n=1 Tax=Kazachstania africana (strain ATCC 22294 / BCRC 22015 / CBS 2517 / CECT 1963 / NBRC 1671 / NRRL Y-8276) TaxID=1071382 RepID=H2AUQ5_KAZAF|nr:hypothetical protein KAFR_0D04570 [Kazachstania africana CBS 2517]CCF58105.1 hypothetical protein KAFR_0D04570 [Kazachstania africana CBS 2517]